MDEIVVVILELLFVYPGAFIRWIFFHRTRKTFREVVKDDWFKNSYIGILVIGFIIGVMYSLFRLS